MKQGPNIAASVHARLLAGAQQRREDFNLTLQRYIAERFLYRLGASEHREQFVLKGAMLFALWGASFYRATKDVDLTGYTEYDPRNLSEMMQTICAVACPEDGLDFITSGIRSEPIRDKSEYHGFRVKLPARLGTAKLTLQVDVGLGDVIDPPAQAEKYPVLVAGPVPVIRVYPREAVIAEKLHAMVVLGTANSRFKDFYDVFILATHFQFSGPVLSRAIAATFARRGLVIDDAQPVALTAAFYANPRFAAEWRQYLSRNALSGAPTDFVIVGERLQAFLGPLWHSLSVMTPPTMWRAGGPWESAL